MSARSPKQENEEAYIEAHLTAQDLVEKIRDLISELHAPGQDEYPAIHWGHVGDLKEVIAKLSDVKEFLERK